MAYNLKNFQQIIEQVSYQCLKQSALDGVTTPGLDRIMQIINDAYSEIVTEYPWRWRFNPSGALVGVVGQTAPYPLAPDCEELLFVLIPQFQMRLWATEYSQWMTNYPGLYTNYGNAKPWSYIEAPFAIGGQTQQLYLFPAPDQPYNLQYGYLSRPVPLVNMTDTIACPPEFQDLIINRAIFKTFEFLNDARRNAFDDSAKSDTPHARRLSIMWMKDQKWAEAVNYLRDIRQERAFTSAMDINRVLFAYGGA